MATKGHMLTVWSALAQRDKDLVYAFAKRLQCPSLEAPRFTASEVIREVVRTIEIFETLARGLRVAFEADVRRAKNAEHRQ